MKPPVIALTATTPPSETFCPARSNPRQRREQHAKHRHHRNPSERHSSTSEQQLAPGLRTSLKSYYLQFGVQTHGPADSHPSISDVPFLCGNIPFLRGMHRLRWFQSRTIPSPQAERDGQKGCTGRKTPPPPFAVLVVLLTLLGTSHCTLAARAGRGRGGGGGGGGGGSKKDVMQLRCPPCRQIHCAIRDPKQLDCKGGVTTGVCGCCPACARLAGESCGGEYAYLGKCDRGLTCLQPPRPSPLPIYPTQRQPAGVCTRRKEPVRTKVRTKEQADEAFAKQCRPLCTQQFCSRRPRAVCSARNGIAETARPCQGNCQHTSCRACAMVDDVECVRCAGDDFRCLKQFGRCVARQRCRGKAGRKYCKRSRLRGNIGRRFVCKVPECPS